MRMKQLCGERREPDHLACNWGLPKHPPGVLRKSMKTTAFSGLFLLPKPRGSE